MERKYIQPDLFGDDSGELTVKSKASIFKDYEAFVEKFKPKKTTDDCYTPPAVYDAVLRWVSGRVDLAGCNVLRPFYPGGDYEKEVYGGDDVVIDNPPFSIITQIVKFYLAHGVRFFLFAPHLTLLQVSRYGATAVVSCADITYENGAVVKTSFATNMLGDYALLGEPTLLQAIKDAQKGAEKDKKKLPSYRYPDEVVTVSKVAQYVNLGMRYEIPKGECMWIKGLDEQKQSGKLLFGGGLLVSAERAARERAVHK